MSFDPAKELRLWLHKRKSLDLVKFSPFGLDSAHWGERGDYSIMWSINKPEGTAGIMILRYTYPQRDSAIASFAMKVEDPRMRWVVLYFDTYPMFIGGDGDLIDVDFIVHGLVGSRPVMRFGSNP